MEQPGALFGAGPSRSRTRHSETTITMQARNLKYHLALGMAASLSVIGARGARQHSLQAVSPASFAGRPAPFADTLVTSGRTSLRQVFALTRTTDERGNAALLYTISVGDTRSRDSLWLDVSTLAPLRHVAKASSGTMDIRFDGDSAVGTRTDSSGSHPVAVHLTRPAFDFSSLPLVLRYLPVKLGDQGMLQTFDVERGPRDLPFRVGTESRKSPGEPAVLMAITVDFGAWQTTYRVDEKSHTYFGYDIALQGGTRRPGARRSPPHP